MRPARETEPASALLALWNDVAPGQEAEYDDWHANEHVPERLRVPGFLWGRRYGSLGGGPRYLTLYGLRDAAVLAGEPYQRLLREPTPRSARMRPALRNVSRWVCRLTQDMQGTAGSHLAVWTLAQPPDVDRLVPAADRLGHLCGERLPDAAALPWLAAGQGSGIEGDWLLCAVLASAAVPAGALPYRRLPPADTPPG